MNDMSQTIVAKSDQINAADLVGITKTITIRDVKIKPGEEQPVSVFFEEDQKAFRPCKGVRRLMVRVWGADASRYVGQSMTLFQDPTVLWAGKPEGGIRVSHMSGLSEEIIEPMRTSRAVTKPYRILPLAVEPSPAQKWARAYITRVSGIGDAAALDGFASGKAKKLAELQSANPALHTECVNALFLRRDALAFETGGEPGDDMGDGFTEDEQHDAETGEVFERDPATGMTVADEETARALDAGADDSSEEAHAEPAAQPHWQPAVDKALGGIRAAKNLSYLTSVEDAWLGARAGVSDESMVKRVDDMIDAARRELRAKVAAPNQREG